MLTSRGLSLLKAASALRNNIKLRPNTRNSAHATWNYRVGAPPADKRIIYIAEGVQGFMWWWMLWHLWTQYDHITGEFEYPDASQWTDEELGIPPEE